MGIKFGRKYTCSSIKDYYFIPTHIDDHMVFGSSMSMDIPDGFLENDGWSLRFFDPKLEDDHFYLISRQVKNTPLARKMYPEGEIEGEWLVVYE